MNGFAYCKMHFDENEKPVDFTYLSTNKAFEEMTGLKNVVGKKVSDVIPGLLESDRELFEIYGRVSKNGNHESLEMFVEALQMWFSLSVYCPQQGYFVAVFDVITGQKKEQEALKESEERFRAIFEQAAVGVALLNTKTGQYVRINQKYCDFLGYTMKEMLQKTLMDVTYKDDIQINIDRNIHLMENKGREFSLEKRYVHRNGNIIWGNLTISPLWKDGEIPVTFFHIAIVEDITERKKTELIIHEQNKQLKELNDTKDKFFSIIAHDLRSPFQGFLSLTQNIAEEAENYTPQELSTIGLEMHKTARNLFTLLKNLLEWAQMQNGSMRFQQNQFSASDLIQENVALIKERSSQKEITIINSVTGNFNVYADKNMISSVLLNLLSNAVKFTHRGGTVTVNVKNTPEGILVVSVCDDGIGINKNKIENLFKVGEKKGTKGTEGELSSGLGLLLCKEFVERNGGKIWVESEEGTGSTFYFSLAESSGELPE